MEKKVNQEAAAKEIKQIALEIATAQCKLPAGSTWKEVTDKDIEVRRTTSRLGCAIPRTDERRAY